MHYYRWWRNGDPLKTIYNYDGLYMSLTLDTKKRSKPYYRTYIRGRGHVWVHRLTIEHRLGRRLTKYEVVHHKDGDTLNNAISNLELTTTNRHINNHNPVKHRWPAKEEDPF